MHGLHAPMDHRPASRWLSTILRGALPRPALRLALPLIAAALALPLAAECGPLPGDAAEGSAPAAAPAPVTLEHRAIRDGEIELPGERPVRVGRGFDFTATLGRVFAAEPAGTSLRVDTDGDGALDVTVESPGGAVTLVGEGGKRYALRLVESAGWSALPGGAAQGEILGTKLRVIDQNLDGDFCDVGEDALVVGRGSVAVPLTAVLSIDGALHELDVAADGASAVHRPFGGSAGTLRLGPCATKAKVLSAVVRSADGRYSFDVARAEEGLLVPAGTYRLASGSIGLGENRVRVAPGRSEPFDVPGGGTREVAWGGPVRAEFEFRRSAGQVDLSPDAVWYYGRAGEEYVGWTPLGKSPRFTLRDKRTGRDIAQAHFPGTC